MNKSLTKTLTAGLMHGLVCEILDYKIDYVGKQFDTIVGIHQWSKEGHWCLITEGGAKPSFDRVKPILFPMSSLTKEIEFKGERFVPIYELAKLFHTVKPPAIEHYSDAVEHGYYGAQCTCWNSVKEMRYSYFQMPFGEFITSAEHQIIEKLQEWHFNIYNLSPDEFIEVNETNNPY